MRTTRLPSRFRFLLVPTLVGVTFLLAGSAWALSSAPGSSPDDDFHLASIWCAYGDATDVCDVRGDASGAEFVSAPDDVARAPCFAYDPSVSGACSYDLGRQLVGARSNTDGAYPGLFYAALRPFVRESVAESVVIMRLANVALGAVLLALALLLSQPRVRRAVALSWLATLVPLAMFVIPSTNPSSWVVIGLGTYWAFLFRFLSGRAGPGTWAAGALSLVTATLCIGARADGAAYVAVVTLAVALLCPGHLRELVRSPRIVLPALLVLAAVAVFLTSGQSSAVAGLGGPAPPPDRGGWTLLVQNVYAYPGLLLGVFGVGWGLGWLDTLPPASVGALASGAAFVLLVLSVTTYWTRKAVAVLMVAAVAVGLPLYILQAGNNVVGENVQPRYLLPLVTVGLGLCLLAGPTGRYAWSVGRRGTVLLVAAVSLANLFALQTNFRRYVTGIDVSGLDLDAAREWWWQLPIGATLTWLTGALAGGALFTSLAVAAQMTDDEVSETDRSIAPERR